MFRLARVLLAAAAVCCLVAPATSASAATNNRPSAMLGDLWTTVLETPTPDNPFTGGSPCVHIGRTTLAPFGPNGVSSCTVRPGTKIFVAVWTSECSSFEGNGTTEAQLAACAQAADQGITTHTAAVDGRPVPVTEVLTGLLKICLPADNIFGLSGADRNGSSVAHGWVTLVNPLTPGTHTIDITVAGTVNSTVRTTIVVE
jgi:hypothetical protein